MVAIQSGPDTIQEKALDRDYPNEEGLEAGTNTQEGRVMNLEIQEKSLVPDREKAGF